MTSKHGPDGQTGGDILYDEVLALNESDPGITVEKYDCLWACGAACNVQITAADKIGYHLANFKPDTQSAAAITDYAREYSLTDDGTVAFEKWPDGVKGHFVVRLPSS